MKFLIVALFVAAAYAVEHPADQAAQIVANTYEQAPDGAFKAAYETSNGIASEITGTLKTVDNKNVVVEQGSYKYTDDSGVAHEAQYQADELGFRVQSADLPTPPAPEAIPEYIARSLEWIAQHPYEEKKQ